MTEHRDLLENLSQIFIAFAGFAGVVAAFSTIRLSPEATVFRVRALVVVALFSLVISLLPYLAAAFNTPEASALRMSALIFGLGTCGIGLWIWRQLRLLYLARALDTQLFAVLLYVAAVPMTICLFAVSAGFAREFAAAIYLSGLYYGIVLCAYYFTMVILAVDIKTEK